MGGRGLFENLFGNIYIYIQNFISITKNATKMRLIIRQPEYRGVCIQSRQRSALPPERPMNGERPERNRDRTGTGTTGTERRSVPFLAFLAFPVVPVHSSEKMERCLLKLSCYQTKRNLTFKTIQSDHSSRSNTYSKTVLS